MPKIIRTIIFLLIISGGTVEGQVPDFCLTRDEYKLYSLINDYRTKEGLGIIPVSKSLCYVAKIHARDLYFNNPDTSSCTLNSWSDRGIWTPCCHSAASPNPACIVNKPKELAKYPGEGHELAYWDSENCIPDTALKFWQSVEQTRDILLNQKKWSYFNWKAIGIGLYKGYACVWLGEVQDTIPEPSICPDIPGADYLELPLNDYARSIIEKPTGRFYIIFGSYNTKEDAAKEVEKYKKEGFRLAKTVISGEACRVSLADFPTQQEAIAAKKKLGDKFNKAWITKY